MKDNTEKCHLMISTDQSVDFQLAGSLIERGNCEKMLGVKIYYKLNFEAKNKLRALARATPYINVEKENTDADELIFQRTA